MGRDVVELNPDKVCPNLRMVYPQESIDALCRSIRTEGQLEPIRTWFDGKHLRILDGEKRWRACKRLGIVRMKALLVKA